MNTLAYAITTLFLIGTLSATAAPEAADPAKAPIALIQASGDTALLNMAYNTATDVQEPLKSRLGEKNAAKLQTRLESTVPGSAFMDGYLRAYRKHEDASKLKAGLAFFQSPLFKKLKRAEEDSETEAGQEAFARYIETIDKQGITPAREKLINDLVIKAGVLATVLGMFDMALENQMRVANGFLSAKEAFKEADIRRIVAETRKSNGKDLQIAITSNLLYTYKAFTDDELRKYSDFLLNKDGKWYYGILLDGLTEGFKIAGAKAEATP